MRVLRSDNGGEYMCEDMVTYMKSRGVVLDPTVLYNPRQNGVAEWLNRTFMDFAGWMLGNKNVEKDLWAEHFPLPVMYKTGHYLWNWIRYYSVWG